MLDVDRDRGGRSLQNVVFNGDRGNVIVVDYDSARAILHNRWPLRNDANHEFFQLADNPLVRMNSIVDDALLTLLDVPYALLINEAVRLRGEGAPLTPAGDVTPNPDPAPTETVIPDDFQCYTQGVYVAPSTPERVWINPHEILRARGEEPTSEIVGGLVTALQQQYGESDIEVVVLEEFETD